jgi:formylglycine-generating enzyme required for sulfatase activity
MKWSKRILLSVLLSILSSGSLFAQQARLSLGVWDFDTGEALPRDANMALCDVLRSELFLTGKFDVLERGDMDRLLQQRGFQREEHASTEYIVEAGRALGVLKMVAGNIGKIGATYTINLRLIDVKTGTVDRVANETCRCEIDDLVHIVGAAAKTLAESETPAEQLARIERERNARQAEEQKPTEKKTPEFSTEGMILVPAGKFIMGSPEDQGDDYEHPQHTVYLDAYYIDTREVTNAQFKKFVDDTHYVTEAERDGWSYVYTGKGFSKEKGLDWRHPYTLEIGIDGIMDHPVVHVSWTDAVAYATWAGKRLPTEAEWEKAARGPDGRQYPWGNATTFGGRCNFADKRTDYEYSDRGTDDGYKYTAPVGKYAAGRSPYGLDDMAGNVQEWCFDWCDNDYYVMSPKTNPMGPAYGEVRARRGGGWCIGTGGLYSARRWSSTPSFRAAFLGFRCAQTAKQ